MDVMVVVLGLLEAGVILGVLYAISMKRKTDVQGVVEKYREQLVTAEGLRDRFNSLFSEMVGADELVAKAREFQSLQESLKVERGRITITQAELETVENRLRELEEIERELEASGIEAKEELKILERKEREIREKNNALKDKINQSMAELDRVLGEIEVSAQIQEQIENMRTELLRTQQQIDTLLLQVEQGNEQYMILKRRYDALDIEYAQLYEKFAEVEAPQQEGE